MRITSRFSIDFTPLVLCLFLATALWLYASMREEYSTVIDVPLEIRLPQGRALETETVSVIRAQVQGAGWQLVNHYLSSSIRCILDISEKRLVQAQGQSVNRAQALINQSLVNITVSRQMLSQAIQSPVGVLVQRVLSDSLVFAVGTIAEKRVPLVAVLDVEAREGFVVTPSYRLTPDSITIRSSKTMLARINAWRTDVISLRDVYESVNVQADLADTLSGVVQFSRRKVLCALNVQQLGELMLEDVPVTLTGAPATNDVVLRPTRVSVLLRGGIEDIAKVSREQIHVGIDYGQISANESGALKPSVSAPPDLQVVRVSPQYIRVMRSVRAEVRR